METKYDKTVRGFGVVSFKDYYGSECSVQESSIVEPECVWVGVNDVQPKIMKRDAHKFGIQLPEGEEVSGWMSFPIPDEVLLSSRMHLNKDQVESLIKILQNWLETSTVGEQYVQ